MIPFVIARVVVRLRRVDWQFWVLLATIVVFILLDGKWNQ